MTEWMRGARGRYCGVGVVLGVWLIAALAPGAAWGQATDASPAPAFSVQFHVVPDQGADNAAVTAPLERARDALGEPPATLDAVSKWSDRLTNALRQGGFPVGQVLMTQGDWDAVKRTKTYVFSVFPGRISSIKIKNSSRVSDDRLARLVTKALCGTDDLQGSSCLLETKRLERATQLLQDVPGVGMDGAPQISAGAGVGDVAVEFPLRELGKPVQASAVVNNNGIKTTGAYQYGVTMSGNNLFHAGDSYYATALVTDKGEWTGTAGASTPLGSEGLRLAGSVARSQYSVNDVTPIVGKSTVSQVGLQYPFARGLDSNIWGGVWFVHNRSGSDLTDFGVGTHSTINSLQLSLTADNGDRAKQLRTDRWSAQGAVTYGHNSNDDTSDSVVQRRGDYAKATGTLFGSYGLNRSGDLFLTGQTSGQLASRNLDGSERLSLGGPFAVRAYRADEGSVDEGVVANTGIYQRFPVATGHQLQVGVFMDAAWGKVNRFPWLGWESSYVGVPDVTNIRKLAGYGVGLGWLTPIGATVSLSAARPFGFSKPSWIDPDGQPTQYWLALSWSQY